MIKKVLLGTVLLSVIMTVNGAYTSVECSTDPVYGENSCDQCFDGGELKQGDNISFLDDVWVNDTTNKKIMYKEEQKLPELQILNGASISKKPNDDTFWEYTSEFEALKNTEFDGYVLPAGEKVSWIKSSMGAAYKVDATPTQGQNIGMMTYEIMSHNILESGEIAMSDKAHKECVLYKAGAGVTETPIIEETPIVKEEPAPKAEEMTQVKTGPEMYLLVFILSFMIGLMITKKELLFNIIRK